MPRQPTGRPPGRPRKDLEERPFNGRFVVAGQEATAEEFLAAVANSGEPVADTGMAAESVPADEAPPPAKKRPPRFMKPWPKRAPIAGAWNAHRR